MPPRWRLWSSSCANWHFFLIWMLKKFMCVGRVEGRKLSTYLRDQPPAFKPHPPRSRDCLWEIYGRFMTSPNTTSSLKHEEENHWGHQCLWFSRYVKCAFFGIIEFEPVTEDMKLDQAGALLEHLLLAEHWSWLCGCWGEKERIKFNFVCIAL